MKKFLFRASSMLLSVALVAMFAACNNNPDEPEKQEPNGGDPAGQEELVLSTQEVEIPVTESVTVNITSGNGGYAVISADESIATASVEGTVITIVGVKAGTTTISVKDAAKKAKPIAVKVSASGVNNINTQITYTIKLNAGEEGYTNWWHPTLTAEAKSTFICTKRDFKNGTLNSKNFDASTCGEFFDLQDDDNVFVAGGYLGEGSKPDYGYAAPAFLLTNDDDPAHPGCKKMLVITSNIAAYLGWSAYSSTGGTAWYNPADGSFTVENAKGFLDWQGSENEKWHFTLCRTYTPEK